MATKEEVLDAISNMTVIELKELLDAFEEKFEVTAAAPVAVAAAAPAGGGGGDAAAEEEKDEFDVVLRDGGPDRLDLFDIHGTGLRVGPIGVVLCAGHRTEAADGEGQQGRCRSRQGQARRSRRHRRTEVTDRSVCC